MIELKATTLPPRRNLVGWARDFFMSVQRNAELRQAIRKSSTLEGMLSWHTMHDMSIRPFVATGKFFFFSNSSSLKREEKNGYAHTVLHKEPTVNQ